MSLPPRARGVKVLKAVSSPLRLQILNLLFDKSALSYTELMNQLKMNPNRDAGRFAYHLKFLLKADLVEVDADAKKYYLTDLGKMVIDVADRVEKKAVKTKGMLVRTSHFTFEQFNPNKIANSLIREAKMPPELAKKTSKETEKILLKAKIKYLTAPLIREVVNTILIEKGLEEYRHKLTRLGLPVHEVFALIENKEQHLTSQTMLTTAGKTVFREYTLLNVFPRDIADAHVSGTLHIHSLSTWVLKPNEVMHDLRFFLQNGTQTINPNGMQLSENPPANFESALAMTLNVLLQTKREVNDTQTLSFFNVFLAPYIKNLEPQTAKENLRNFILNVSQHADSALALELSTPMFIADKPAIGPNGKTNGTYQDYEAETQQLAKLVLEIYAEECALKPILNPKLIVKINNETLSNENAKTLLLQAHSLAADKVAVYFGNLLQKEAGNIAFSASGVKLEANLKKDWETDTLRTGCVGYVTLNLPRMVTENGKDKTKFFSLLKERCELAARALGIKNRALKQHGKTSLPFLMQNCNGDTYFRLENCSGIINLAGLKEAAENFTGKPFNQPETLKFAEETAQNSVVCIRKMGRKHGKRIFPAILHSPEASSRLAQLDIERYGIAKVKVSGTRDKPFYSTSRRMQLEVASSPYVSTEETDLQQKLQSLNQGGNLTILALNEDKVEPEELSKLTVSLMEKQNVEFLTYNHAVTYCSNCHKSWFGELRKCPSCGSIGTVSTFDRFSGT